jgi:hypothetical protein
MRLIGLKEAVASMRRTVAAADLRPYFFMVGAGLSVPAVLTASQIIEMCKHKYQQERIAEPTLADPNPPAMGDPRALYSYWLTLAYPEPAARAMLFKLLVRQANPTPANVKLAQLIDAGSLARTVFTTNYDDLLQRALDTIGARYVVCDHPYVVQRVDPNPDRPQIVYIHGSFDFYDVAYIDAEKRASSGGMHDLLLRFMYDSVPIVVGYGAWEDDAFMRALRRRLHESLRYTLRWFVYRRADIDALPQWLTAHANVEFVVPDADEPVLPHGPALRNVVDPVLTADAVFDELLRAFNVKAPECVVQRPVEASSGPFRALRAFLCHGTEDKTAVRALYALLKKGGFQPWLDEKDIGPGEDWKRAISQAVREADVVLVCLSRTSTAKIGFVNTEIRYALDRADQMPEGVVYIIPLRLDDCILPDRLSQWQAVDTWSLDYPDVLLEALRKRSSQLGL